MAKSREERRAQFKTDLVSYIKETYPNFPESELETIERMNDSEFENYFREAVKEFAFILEGL